MANAFTEYIRDTRAELRHVAWPTQRQTVVFTILVSAISLGIAAYLGAFDYIFTHGLTQIVGESTQSSIPVTQEPAAASGTPAQTSAQNPVFGIPGASSTSQ